MIEINLMILVMTIFVKTYLPSRAFYQVYLFYYQITLISRFLTKFPSVFIGKNAESTGF